MGLALGEVFSVQAWGKAPSPSRCREILAEGRRRFERLGMTVGDGEKGILSAEGWTHFPETVGKNRVKVGLHCGPTGYGISWWGSRQSHPGPL
jgi:hypothetical protein